LDAPLGKLAAPFRKLAVPFGKLATPIRKLNAPFVKLDAPFGKLAAPFGKLDASFEKLAAPIRKLNSPFVKLDAPFIKLDALFGKLAAPFGKLAGPFRKQVTPFVKLVVLFHNVSTSAPPLLRADCSSPVRRSSFVWNQQKYDYRSLWGQKPRMCCPCKQQITALFPITDLRFTYIFASAQNSVGTGAPWTPSEKAKWPGRKPKHSDQSTADFRMLGALPQLNIRLYGRTGADRENGSFTFLGR
jgi:hypothetical protein